MSDRIVHPVVYSDTYRVRAHEVSVGHTLSMPALLMMLQDASMGSAAELRVSVQDASMDRLGWVLLRKKIKILRNPLLRETVTVDTFPSYFDRAFAHRDYYMYGASGEVLATSSSVWTLLDLDKRRMAPIPQMLREMELPSVRLPLPDRRVSAITRTDVIHSYTIRYHDIDWNHHLNNISLFKYILQCVPQSYIDEYRCVPTEITYIIKAESYLDDTLIVSTQVLSDSEMLHEVRRESDDALIAQARTIWS